MKCYACYEYDYGFGCYCHHVSNSVLLLTNGGQRACTAGLIAITEWDQPIQEPKVPGISVEDIIWTAPTASDSAAFKTQQSALLSNVSMTTNAGGNPAGLFCLSCKRQPVV